MQIAASGLSCYPGRLKLSAAILNSINGQAALLINEEELETGSLFLKVPSGDAPACGRLGFQPHWGYLGDGSRRPRSARREGTELNQSARIGSIQG